GSIAPGKCADIIILDDLQTVEPTLVMTDGQVVVENKQIVSTFPSFTYPKEVKHSVHIGKRLAREDFLLTTNKSCGSARVDVIKGLENSARTVQIGTDMAVDDGKIRPDIERDIIPLVCSDRHHQSARISLGVPCSFQLKHGA